MAAVLCSTPSPDCHDGIFYSSDYVLVPWFMFEEMQRRLDDM